MFLSFFKLVHSIKLVHIILMSYIDLNMEVHKWSESTIKLEILKYIIKKINRERSLIRNLQAKVCYKWKLTLRGGHFGRWGWCASGSVHLVSALPADRANPAEKISAYRGRLDWQAQLIALGLQGRIQLIQSSGRLSDSRLRTRSSKSGDEGQLGR